MTILEKVKELLNLTTNEFDNELNFYISYLTDDSIFYTLRNLDESLENVIIMFTIKLHNAKIIEDDENIKQIKDGDTTISFGGGSFSTKQIGIIDDFRYALKPFREVKAVM